MTSMDYSVTTTIGTEQYIYYHNNRKDAVARILRDVIFLVGGWSSAQLETKSRKELKAMSIVPTTLQKFIRETSLLGVKDKGNKFEMKWANLVYSWVIRKTE